MELSVQNLPPFFYLQNAGSNQFIMANSFSMAQDYLNLFDPRVITGQLNDDYSLWYAEDMGDTRGMSLTNKKSGLNLGRFINNNLATLAQYVSKGSTDRVGWRITDAGSGHCRIEPASGLVHTPGSVLSQNGNHKQQNQNHLDLRVAGSTTDSYFLWLIQPVGSLQPDYRLTIPDRDKVNGGRAKVAELFSDVLKLSGDIVKSAGSAAPTDKVAAAFYTGALGAKLVGGISGLVDYFSDEGDDPTELLYRAMMPAIKDLIGKVEAAPITDAAGDAAAARIEFEQISDIVNRTMAKLDTSARISDKDLRSALGNDLDGVHDHMNNARQNFDRALGKLEVHEDGFVPWVQIAGQSLAFELLRFSIEPIGHAEEARSHAKYLKNHATRTLAETKKNRRDKIVNGGDTYHSAPNKIAAPMDIYQAHLDRTVELALGGDAVIELVAACDAMMRMVDNIQKVEAH